MREFEQTLRTLLNAGHTARFVASGDSMYPSIRGGDHLHIVPCRVSELHRGDIVLAAMERGLTAHRIVRISERGGTLRITTRGDNSLRSDRPIGAEDVLGRVARVEGTAGAGKTPRESATIMRLATVFVRRLRARFQQ